MSENGWIDQELFFCHDSVSLFISFNKNILTTFQPVTLAFIRFEVIHKFKNQNIKQSQCACAGMRTCVDGGCD